MGKVKEHYLSGDYDGVDDNAPKAKINLGTRGLPLFDLLTEARANENVDTEVSGVSSPSPANKGQKPVLERVRSTSSRVFVGLHPNDDPFEGIGYERR